jgi:SAM-dependent methyltransferase
VFSRQSLNNLLIRAFGWYGFLLHGDQTILDRWRWLRGRVRGGELRTLDAGCGSGGFALYAAKRGNDVIGLNWDERDVATATERARILGLTNARFRAQDLRRLDAISSELGEFDQIICCEVIEHVIDDGKLVTDLASLLSPDGRLLLTTPSDRHREIPGEYIATYEDGGHVRYGYSHDDLRRLADHAGLEVASLGYLVGPLSQALFRVYFRLGRVNRFLGWGLTVPLRPLSLLDSVVSRFLTTPPYCVTAVLRRPPSEAPVAGR